MNDNFIDITLDNVCSFKDYFTKYPSDMCEYTIGEKYMWRNVYKSQYLIHDGTLYMKDTYRGKSFFYCPLGEDISKGLDFLSGYAIKTKTNLSFTCLEEKDTSVIKKRFPHSTIYTDRDIADYIYDSLPLSSFTGKHLSGKRYFLNKFMKSFPDYKFHIATKDDEDKLLAFYDYDETKINFDNPDEKEEYQISLDLIKNFYKLNQVCGYITVEDKIIAYSIGEIVGDVLFVHIEKALTSYIGSFQIMVKEFASHFGLEKVKYINREDDDGDLGLRTSKTQYHPLLLRDKYFLSVNNNLDLITKMPELIIDNHLTLSEILSSDKKDYFNLSVDDDLNKFWGYDYRTDIPEDVVNEDNVYQMLQDDFEKKDDLSFAIKEDGHLIGEVVFHELDNANSSSIGMRVFKKNQGKQIGFKALNRAIKFAFEDINMDKLLAKCYKENTPSYKTLLKAGFIMVDEDDVFYHFELNRDIYLSKKGE